MYYDYMTLSVALETLLSEAISKVQLNKYYYHKIRRQILASVEQSRNLTNRLLLRI